MDDRWPCREIVARLRIPELEIDVPAVAYVLPRELTDRLSPLLPPSELSDVRFRGDSQ